MGQQIGEYFLMSPLQNQNAGFSRWAFATKNGDKSKKYFLKEFLDPVYPDDKSLSEALRNRRIADCRMYEDEKKKLYDAINKANTGNIVSVIDYFRFDSHYYIVTDQINQVITDMARIQTYPLETRVLLCLTAAESIRSLHENHIIHADIKADNMMIHLTSARTLVAKLIDFDCSFFENNPPEDEDDLGGDQVYFSPEACLFVCGEDVKLSSKMDVFSLGLLFHQYLTGELPAFSDEYDYVHEALLDESEIVLNSSLSVPLKGLIARMLELDPEKRIDSNEVYRMIRKIYYDLIGYVEEERVPTSVTVPASAKLMSAPAPASASAASVSAAKSSTSSKLKMGTTDWFHQAGDL